MEEIKTFGVEADYHVAKGTASKRIAELAEKENISMIMLGRGGTDMATGLELGSTAENVILKVDRSLLLLPVDDNDD